MGKKLLILVLTISNAGLILFVLCLGTQNLNNRNPINLGFSSTPAYPNGFILGLSITLGFISGGSTSIFLMPSEEE